MANVGDFNPNGVRKFRSASGQSELHFGAWNGNTTLTIFQGKGRGERPKSIVIANETRLAMGEVMQALLTAAPGAKTSIILSKWDAQAQPRPTYKRDCTIILGKDEHGIIFIEVVFEGQAPELFPIKGNSAVEISSEDNSPTVRSRRSAKELCRFIMSSWEIVAIKCRTVQPPRGGSNASKSSGGSSAPSTPPAQQTAADDSLDDMIY